ncbi:MAG: hypothetical protein A3J40_09150 [Erythrobacter sp. RIFCSPHIGHO2_12_FULL_63_10]|nr:MAG: hypothetical protein A3J40_09150 [Erythrobacter sp. RIFCSPHIGHO2_12_FULL_63_10]
MMNFAKLAILATAIAATPIAASAAGPEVGATVYGPQGNPVGTIESVANGQAVLDTGKHKVPLGIESFGESEAGPTITVTKEQLDGLMDEQIAAAIAQRDAALVVGAAVVSADAQVAGTVKEIDASTDAVVVERDSGLVTLKREHFAVDGNGALIALFTLEQIDGATVATGG